MWTFMLERVTSHSQIFEIHNELKNEDNWYWWIEGAYPDYDKFEDWVRGCQNDAIGFFLNTIKKGSDSSKLLGFSRFSQTNLMHGFTYLTVWVLPSLRNNRGLTPHGFIAAAEAINFAFHHFPLRKIYQNVVEENLASLRPLRKVAHVEGTLKEHYFFNGKYCNLVTLSITRDSWFTFYDRYQQRLGS